MNPQLGDKLLSDYESGTLSRRQLVTRLMGLGAALATLESTGQAQESTPTERPMFQATGLDHIALDVTDVPRSRDFYMKHLGLRVIRGGDDSMFLGADRDFFLALFRSEQAGMNHYCYAIKNYDPDAAVDTLRAAGIEPRRTSGRVYFPDPDGLEVQIARGEN